MRTLSILSASIVVALAAACSIPDKALIDGGGDDIDAATDGAGTDGDTSGPETTITEAPPAVDNSTTVAFSFTSDEATATFECKLDNAAFAVCVSPKSYPALTDGSHIFEVRAVDTAGNPDASPATHTWSIDSSTPDTQINTGPTGTVASTSATFTFSSSDAGAGATFECQLDGGTFGACTTSAMHALSGLGQGAHTFAVRVRDSLGNVDPTPAMRAWIADTVLPDTTITGGPSGAVASTMASFALTSNEATVTFECNLDSGGFVACSATHAITVGQNSHTLQVRAVDAAGNRDASPASRTWSVDTVPPDTTIVSGPLALTNSTSASFDFSSEVGATFQCNLDGAGFVTCPDPYTFTATVGNRSMQVRALDALGNFDLSPASHSWTIDQVDPTTTITSGPAALVNSTTASFMFTSSEAGTFECNLDGAGYAACPASHTITGAAQGNRTLLVRAVDLAGNRDQTPAQHLWTVDSVVPVVTIQAPVASSTTGPRITVTFTVSETGTTTLCRFDGGAQFPCASGSAYNLPAAAHSLVVQATDAATNVGSTTRSWTVACSDSTTDASTFLFLKLEEADGVQSLVNTADATTPGYKGTVVGTDVADPVSLASGRFGRALNLPQVAAPPAKQFRWQRTSTAALTAFTVELWVRPTATEGGWPVFNDVFADRFSLLWNNTTSEFGVYMFDWDGDMGFQRYLPAAPNQWHHVVAVWTGTQVTLYVDGASVTVSTATGNFVLPMSTFRFGAQGETYLDYTGDIDSVLMSSRAFTPTEVLDRYCPAQ